MIRNLFLTLFVLAMIVIIVAIGALVWAFSAVAGIAFFVVLFLFAGAAVQKARHPRGHRGTRRA